MSVINIQGRLIGPGYPVFVIAEAGVNHNGKLSLALRLVEEAARAGADAVKFQTFKSSALVCTSAPKADYQKETTGAEESQLEMIQRLELSEASHHALLEKCRECGILFLSTPFDLESLAFLTGLGVGAVKLSSGEVTNPELLAAAAKTGLPVILSTGMSTLAEVGRAVGWLRENGAKELALLQCVTQYPASPAETNLRAMETLRDAFAAVVGYSDHTLGSAVSLAAVALGASVIEKHITLDRTLPGPDHAASLETSCLGAFVDDLRTVEAALGTGVKEPAPSEADTRAVARRSVVAARSIRAGELLTPADFLFKRPGTGLSPFEANRLAGKTAKVDIPADTLILEGMVS